MFFQEQVFVLTFPHASLRSDRNAARRELGLQDNFLSFCHTVETSQAFVLTLMPLCGTLQSKLATLTLRTASLQAEPPVVFTGLVQLEYDAIV